eukprot:TRINITY_DN1959_c0_g1_i1.p1 TRINITY_DN1959_c0_g1~~TRINITY_DN1959_c0_g1_i1.p1  ORF type:complete len:132 (+),score=22.69 TRINITY_DN1959_c0_g1_i1:221-616(+)
MALSLSVPLDCANSLVSSKISSLGTGKVKGTKFRVVCKKKDIHPQYHKKAKFYCEGELVLVTGGTKPQYEVDVWAGNHSFYLNERTDIDPFAEREKRRNRVKADDGMPRGELSTEVMIGGKIKHIKLRRRF